MIKALIILILSLFNPVFAMSPEEAIKADRLREYYLKGAFLRYVAEFIGWPKETISEKSITICVYGELPAIQGIQSIHGKVVNNRTIQVKKISELQDIQPTPISGCHILYVGDLSQTPTPDLKTVLAELKTLGMLTFGDKAGFSEQSGCMNFFVNNNRMGIMLNKPMVDLKKLTVQPRMLKLVTLKKN